MLDNLPQSISTPELNISLPEGSNGHQVIEELAAKAEFEGATEIITIDGLRVEFPDGFGLMRASNTTPIWCCVLKRIRKQPSSAFKTDSKPSSKAIRI
ncbi:phosphoglucomutase [Neisseria gonorrhoeae]|uniref:Phosphoglucomutase n=1 Tax=Neisseria gonorrhoeae TaxID=485 RepID=A0A378VYS8_NEIGO|nr:phosphoglucomutase [Neisseria gonorrhoeae]